MSSNGNAAPNQTRTSSALDIGFSSVADADRYGESSSRADSRSSGKRSHHSEEHRKEPETPQDTPSRQNEEANSTGSLGRRNRKSGGFLLESAFANGSPRGPQDVRGKRKAQDGQLRVEKRRHGGSRLSGDSSLRGSPLSREVANIDGVEEEPAPRSVTMDPAQLVQMALNLSESRKRHVSNTLQVPLPSPRRATSGPMSHYGTVRATSSSQNRSSQLSDDLSRDSPSSNRSGMDDQVADTVPVIDFGADNVFHTFSPATLSRAEKARKYFELASEHRRLLQSLPPLKPDSSAPGNYTFESMSTPGSAYPEITRVPSTTDSKHPLGRQYNPIQSLRNRRVRIREKRPFPAPPDTWQDPEKVKNWIDDVETASKDRFYRATENKVHVPPFDGDDNTAHTRSPEKSTRHRRTDTVGSVITRPENSWTIEPTELLADQYWMLKGDNQNYVETRFGNAIFPSQPRKSLDAPKISIEMHRDRGGDAEMGNDSDTGNESARPSRRRRLMMPLIGQSEGRKNRRIISRSSSTSSGSSFEGRAVNKRSANREIGYENIGPLERHMSQLIAMDANGELSSPEMTSPDHWNMPYQRKGVLNSYGDSINRTNGRSSLDVPRDVHRRSKSAEGRVNSLDQAMSSTEDLTSEPVSPVVQRQSTSIGTEASHVPGNRRSLDEQRSRGLAKLSRFRSNSKERNKIGQVDFADGAGTNLSPILSGDTWRPRTSQDSERPSAFRRHKTNDSTSNDLQRLDTASTTGTFSSSRETGSSVGRFFKGGRDRLGGLVRGDAPRFSDRLKARDKLDSGALSDASRAASDVSDLDEDPKVNGSLKKRLTDSTPDDSDVSPRASLDRTRSKPKYNLPSFTSSARDKRLRLDTTMSRGDSTDQQQKTTRESGTSEKSDRPAIPHIKFTQDSEAREPKDPFKFSSFKFDTAHKSYGELAAFGATAAGAGGPGSMSRSPRQRHWSIYDQAQPVQADKITSRDIARARALLLCSGIKAREIQRRGNHPRDTISAELFRAAETAGQSVERVPLKDEHLFAARMLSTHLSSTLSELEAMLTRFQSQTAKNLESQLDELQHKGADHLTALVHETSDEADAFTVELTTKQVQQTKRVDEAVDDMLRQRRRQFRLLRRAGFKLLEWLVLGIMWWIWFTVVVFNTCKRIIVAIFRFLRWLFTF